MEKKKEWQPIETAPKDGTALLVCCLYDAGGAPSYHIWVDAFYDGHWIEFPRVIQAPFPPTHWMPLPTPPGADE